MKALRTTTGGMALRDFSRIALPVLQNLASTGVGTATPRAPAFITWGVTERCQLSCLHCAMNRPRPGELGHQQRLLVTQRIARSGAWGVSLIGGEPFLAPGLMDYAELLKGAGKWVSIGTNGVLLGPHIERILDLEVDALTLSFDAHTAEAHDRFRGRAGLFHKTLGFLETLRARRRGQTPRLQVRATINRTNFRDLEALIEFWSVRADYLILQIVQNNGIHSVRDPACLFRPEDRTDFEDTLARARQRFPFLSGPYYDYMSRYVFEPARLYEDIGFRCLLVPAVSMTVLADGDVKLCHGRPDATVGSLLRDEVETIWRGEQTRATQHRMQSKEYGCMCWEASNMKNLDLVSLYERLGRAMDWMGLR